MAAPGASDMVVVVTGGDAVDPAHLPPMPPGTRVVAADSGIDHAHALRQRNACEAIKRLRRDKGQQPDEATDQTRKHTVHGSTGIFEWNRLCLIHAPRHFGFHERH